MQQAELEKKLSRIMRTRRLIEGFLALVCIALAVVFYNLWEVDRSYVHFLVWSSTAAMVFPFLLIVDCMICRYRTTEKCSRYITVYRGMVYLIVYVGGREISRIPRQGYVNYIEAWITAEVRATVCFTRTISYIAHISFSDHSPSVEI